MMKQFDWLCCWTVTANLATSTFFLFLSPCILRAKQVTSCHPWWNKHSFLYTGNQNQLLVLRLSQSSLTSFILLRRRCLLTYFPVQYDHFTPEERQPLDSGDQPETDGSLSTCFNTVEVLPSTLVFLLSSSWVCTVFIWATNIAEATGIAKQDRCALHQNFHTTFWIHLSWVLSGIGHR